MLIDDRKENALKAILAGLERTDDGRIERSVHIAQNAFDGASVGKCGLVGSFAAEGIINVGEIRQAGGRRDIVAGQAVRVAGAVPAFVVVANHRPGHSEIGQPFAEFAADRLHNRAADNGMRFHHPPFLGRKLGRLQKNCVGQRQLANVVDRDALVQPAAEGVVQNRGPGRLTSKLGYESGRVIL